jgi:hypothetical protein
VREESNVVLSHDVPIQVEVAAIDASLIDDGSHADMVVAQPGNAAGGNGLLGM